MKTPQLPEVNWCQLYSKLLEAVDHAGFNVEGVGEGYFTLTPKVPAEEPTRFILDMDGSMVPDEDGEWVRYG